MAIDRVATLRNAEKLIRQGKLDAGIVEYLRLVDDTPHDWNLRNTLGDLYLRAGQIEKGVEQFLEIGDHLNEEGALAKAAAVYKKILKLKPDHEHSLIQLGELLRAQKLYADARAQLNTLLELRKNRGDARGVLQVRVQIGSLDPEDYDARLEAANARIEMGDVGGAMRDLKEIAGELSEKGRHPEAIEVFRKAATLNPQDEDVRERLYDAYMTVADYVHARECATSVEQFRLTAAAQEALGQKEEALETLMQAAAHHSYDNELRAELARTFIARGDAATAAQYLTVDTAGNDPELLAMVADIQLRTGSIDEGIAILRRLLDQDPVRREKIAVLGWNLAEQKPDAGFQVVELAADAAVAQSDWPAAAAALQEYVTRVPNHVPALMRLVEICVDGGLEATMYSAQAQLADAYLEAGSATEARFIAEDLVAREPWEKSNIERFRRALVMLGEQDADAVIAERLSGESPFMSTDLSFGDLMPEEAPPAPEAPDAFPQLLDVDESSLSVVDEATSTHTRRNDESNLFRLSANAIPLDDILGDLEDVEPEAPEPPPGVEVELSLDDVSAETVSSPIPVPSEGAGLTAVPRAAADDLEKEYKRALGLRQRGDIDGCIEALEKASRSPKLRFSTTWMIARLHRDRGQLAQALEWLERASQAQAPTADDGRQVLYELADGLEKEGEGTRALAVLLELQADAPDYRDVGDRIDRLTKVQARG